MERAHRLPTANTLYFIVPLQHDEFLSPDRICQGRPADAQSKAFFVKQFQTRIQQISWEAAPYVFSREVPGGPVWVGLPLTTNMLSIERGACKR